MDLKKMRYLEAVYRLQSFTKAADELYISQPALTSAIQSLERDLGVTLIQRYYHKFKFTKEGEVFMSHVYCILKDVEKAELEMKDICDHSEQILKLGLSNTVGCWIFPLIFTEFLPRVSHGRVFIEELPFHEMIDELKTEHIDLAYTVIPEDLDRETLDVIPLMKGEVCLVMPINHPLAKYERVPLAELESQRIFSFHKNTYVGQAFDRMCEKRKISPERRYGSLQVGTTLYMVEQGAGLSLVTCDSKTCYVDQEKLALRKLEEPISFQEGFILNKKRYCTRIMREFISYVKQQI